METERKTRQLISGPTVRPCHGAARVEQAPRSLICPCGSDWKFACVAPDFSVSPAKHQRECGGLCTQHAAQSDTTDPLPVTLCCSSFLCSTLAVSSWACWRGTSSLRANSARCSQAPTTPRGPGRDLSRWMCQSNSYNSFFFFLQKKKEEVRSWCREVFSVWNIPTFLQCGVGGSFCHSRQAVDVQWSRLTAEQKPPLFPSPPLWTHSLFKHLYPTWFALAATKERGREPFFLLCSSNDDNIHCGYATITHRQTANRQSIMSSVGFLLNLCTINLRN